MIRTLDKNMGAPFGFSVWSGTSSLVLGQRFLVGLPAGRAVQMYRAWVAVRPTSRISFPQCGQGTFSGTFDSMVRLSSARTALPLRLPRWFVLSPRAADGLRNPADHALGGRPRSGFPALMMGEPLTLTRYTQGPGCQPPRPAIVRRGGAVLSGVPPSAPSELLQGATRYASVAPARRFCIP